MDQRVRFLWTRFATSVFAIQSAQTPGISVKFFWPRSFVPVLMIQSTRRNGSIKMAVRFALLSKAARRNTRGVQLTGKRVGVDLSQPPTCQTYLEIKGNEKTTQALEKTGLSAHPQKPKAGACISSGPLGELAAGDRLVNNRNHHFKLLNLLRKNNVNTSQKSISNNHGG